MSSGKPFPEIALKEYYGFVYCISCNTTNKKYIGKKTFWFKRKPKGKTRRVTQESDWKGYFGSSILLKSMVKEYGKDNFTRTILSIHKTKGDCGYVEVKEQFQNNVLEDKQYINENISGKYFKPKDEIVDKRIY